MVQSHASINFWQLNLYCMFVLSDSELLCAWFKLIFSYFITIILCADINLMIEIIKEPETQYVLTGENATFECHTTVRSGIEDDAHWELNRVPITLSFEKKKQEYEEQGVIFKEDISQEHYNLTMIIPASLDFNNTEITCVAIAPDFIRIFSRNVNIFVFDTLRKIVLNPPPSPPT